MKSEFLGDRLATWKELPRFYLILGVFLLLFGLCSGLFLAAIYRSDTPVLPGPDTELLPFGIRISPEPERKPAPTVQVDHLRKQEPAAVVQESDGVTSVEGPEKETVRPALNEPTNKLVEKSTNPVPGAVGEEVPLKTEAVPSASGPVVEQDLKKIPQEGLVEQDGIDKILETGDFLLYTTTKEDTLWRIAEKCYGSGYYFPVLMECNPSLKIFDMEGGTQVRIFKGNRLAQRLYHKITRMVGNELCFYYRVMAGDTFESIAMKFYNKEGLGKRIKELNPYGELVPGRRIKVALD